MMDRFAALDGAIVQGGRIRLRAGLGARQLAGVDTRAGVLALLLARPIGYTVHGLQAETGMSTGVLESALAGLTIECPALYEYQHGRAWYIAIDRDTWRRSGWYAGSVTRGPRDETEDGGRMDATIQDVPRDGISMTRPRLRRRWWLAVLAAGGIGAVGLVALAHASVQADARGQTWRVTR